MKLATGLLLTAIAVTATFTTAGSMKLSTTNALVNHDSISLRRANKDTPTLKFHRQLAASDDTNMLKVPSEQKISDSYGPPIPLEGLLPPKRADSSNTRLVDDFEPPKSLEPLQPPNSPDSFAFGCTSPESVAFVPNSGPTANPDQLTGLGPQTPFTPSSPNSVACPPTGCTSGPETVTVDRNTLNRIDPETLYGLGPRTPLSPRPLDCPPSGCTEYADTVPFNPTMPSQPLTPDTFQSIGPEVVPGMEGYGQNEKAKQAMDEFVKQEEVVCNEGCSNQVVSLVCGSDGNMYNNLCELQNASCKSPEKCITQATDPSTCNQV